MRLPDPVAYQLAVQHPSTAFTDADLRAATVTTNRLGLPKVVAGNFALTYQLSKGGRQWAVRCFHRDAPDRARRYAAISQTLAGLRDSPLVSIAYLPLGVRVDQQWYAVTKMPWLDGRPFNRAVEARLNSPASLAQLEQRFIALTERLQQLGLAHGDLQHGNILVDQSGALKLVDYDGMYVPPLKGLAASESGDPNYQHPGRLAQFDTEIDRFAALVIVVALHVLAEAPELWPRYNTDDNLLFRRADFVAPHSSPVFRDLRSRPATRELADRFARICQSDYAHIPVLSDFLRSSARRRAVVHSPGGSSSRTAPQGLHLADVLTLNRLYAPARRVKPAAHRSWSMRRAAAQETLAFASDGALLATAESTGKVRLRDAGSGRVVQVWTAPARMTALAYSPDGLRLLATGPDGGLYIWTYKAHATAQLAFALPGEVRCAAFGPNGPLVAVATGSAVELAETDAGRQWRLSGCRGDVMCLTTTFDGHVLAAGATDGSLRCWSIPGGGVVAASRQPVAVTAVALAGDGRALASADTYGTVRVWSVPGGSLSTELQLPVPETVVRLAFSPDGSRIAAAGASGRLVVWTVPGGPVQQFATPTGVASGLAFSPDGACLAVTSYGGGVSLRCLTAARRPARAAPTRLTRRQRPRPRPQTAPPSWLKEVLRRFGAAL